MPQSPQSPWRDAPSDAGPFPEGSLADRLDSVSAGGRRNRRDARHSTSNFSIRSRTSLRQLGMTVRQKFCALLDDADDWGRRYGIPREVMMALVLSAGLFLVIGLALVLI